MLQSAARYHVAMNVGERLGSALRELRERTRKTQREVEGEAGLSSGALSRYEHGQAMELRTLFRLLDALGADFADLGLAMRGGEWRKTGELPEVADRLGFTAADWARIDEALDRTATDLLEERIEEIGRRGRAESAD